MYDLIDRPVADLPLEEREVLMAMRRWVHAFAVSGADHDRLPANAMSDAMRALDAGSVQNIEFQRPCYATVEETEAVILGLWRLTAASKKKAALALAGSIVDADHAPILVDGLCRLPKST